MSHPPTAPRAALYLRLSRDDEKHGESESIANQRRLLTGYAAAHGYTVAAEYADDGWSGTRFDRPQFQKMLREIGEKRIDLILVKDLSRLGRDYLESGRYLEVVFPEMGVRLIAVNDGVDTARSDADLTPFRNVVNELYARDASRKIRSALRAKMQAGQFVGHHAPYGYRRNPTDKNRLLPDDAAAAVVRDIFSQAAGGAPPAVIAAGLNARRIPPPAVYRQLRAEGQWRAQTVARLLRDPVYTGCAAQGRTERVSFKSRKTREKPPGDWIIVPDCHLPLVPQDVFDQAQRQRAGRRTAHRNGFVNLFSGLAFCADCGRGMSTVGTRRRDSRADLACGGYKLAGRAACTSHFIDYDRLYAAVLAAMREQVSLTPEEQDALFSRLCRRLRAENGQERPSAALERRLKQTEAAVSQLYRDRAAGALSDETFYPLLRDFEAQAAALRAALDRPADAGGMIREDVLRRLIARHAMPCALTAPLLAALIDRIEVSQGEYIEDAGGCRKRQTVRIRFRSAPEWQEIVLCSPARRQKKTVQPAKEVS